VPRNAERKPDIPDVFPGEAGFSLLVANETFAHVGKATKCHYRFVTGKSQYVDKRDQPGLPREKFNK
jgi:hypothetical protein